MVYFAIDQSCPQIEPVKVLEVICLKDKKPEVHWNVYPDSVPLDTKLTNIFGASLSVSEIIDNFGEGFYNDEPVE